MAQRQRRQRGEAAIATSIASRRNDFLNDVQVRQKQAQQLTRIAQSNKAAITKAQTKLSRQRKAVQDAERRLAKQQRAFERAENKAKAAETALAVAEEALGDFDKRLAELVGGSAAKRAGRKRSATKSTSGGRKTNSGTRRGKRARKITQRQALSEVLPNDQGIAVEEVLQRVNDKFGMEIKKSSAGTTLSLLKRDGLVAHDGIGWRAAITSAPETGEVDEAPSVEPSTEEGA